MVISYVYKVPCIMVFEVHCSNYSKQRRRTTISKISIEFLDFTDGNYDETFKGFNVYVPEILQFIIVRV